MRLQLFKGTYGILMAMAVAGLFLMLRRQAGDGLALGAWVGLVIIGAAGLVATNSDLWAAIGSVAGLLLTAYAKWGIARSANLTGGQAMQYPWTDLALATYLLLAIVMFTIWRARSRRSKG